MTDAGRELPSSQTLVPAINEIPCGELVPQARIARIARLAKESFRQSVAEPIGKGNGSFGEVGEKLNKWVTGNYVRFRNLVNAYLKENNGMLTGEQKQQIGMLLDDQGHDLAVVIAPLQMAFLGSERHKGLLTSPVVDFPGKVLERFARRAEGKKVVEDINPRDSCRNVYDFFKAFLSSNPKTNIVLNIEGDTFSAIQGDPLDFEAALFNLVRNSQKRLSAGKGTNIAINLRKLKSGASQIEVADDAGGFDTGSLDNNGKPAANLLDEAETVNSKGEKVTTQLAFVRGESRGEEKGSGLGLDIARRIIEDDFGGKIVAWNAKFKETENQGALITIDLPAGNKEI